MKRGRRPLDMGKVLPAPSCFVDLISVHFCFDVVFLFWSVDVSAEKRFWG